MEEKARVSFLRCESQTHPDIVLPEMKRITLGRGPLTGIRDGKCSREQLAFVANYEEFIVRVEQVGGNPSKADRTFKRGEVVNLKHGDTVEFLPGAYRHRILFDPAPKEEPPTDTTSPKRIKLTDKDDDDIKSDSAKAHRPREETLHCNEIREWKYIDDGKALVMTHKDSKAPSTKVAVFDMDGTIITTKSGKVFPTNIDDWQILYPEVPGKLKNLVKEGYKIVIYTNQAGVARGKMSVDDLTKKIENILIRKLGIPCIALACTASGGLYRKPRTGLWELFLKRWNGGVKLDYGASFYVGDAAGRLKDWKPKRKKDFSSSDRLFAANAGLKFLTPEEYFLGEKPTARFKWPEFNPRELPGSDDLLDPPDSELERTSTQEVVMMVGIQGSGKSFFARTYLKNHTIASNDISGSRDKTMKLMERALSEGKNVVLDNTHAEVETRKKYLDKIRSIGRNVRTRCFVMNTSPLHARHNNLFRELIGEDHVKINEILLNQFANKYVEPSIEEGFDSIVRVKFVPRFGSPKDEALYRSYLLEK